MDRDGVRTWGPVVAVVLLLPVVFVLLRALLPPIGHPPATVPASEAPSSVAPAPAPADAGPAGCAGCHASQHAAWTGSNHALAERPVGPDDPLVDGVLEAVGRSGSQEPYRPVRVL